MTLYLCDGIKISAESAQAAAQSYVDGGHVDEDELSSTSTIWLDISVQTIDGADNAVGRCKCIQISVDPSEPDCTEAEHAWQSPYEVLGGLEDNPGVWGHGGGVIMRECCSHCGAYRITDTWATNPSTGEEGLDSISYEAPDEASLTWACPPEADD